MKSIIAILFCVMTGALCWGQERIASTSYWTATGAAIGAATADAITTSLMVGKGHGCRREVFSPSVYGTQPTPARTVLIMAGGVSLAAIASYEAKKHLHGKAARLWSVPLLYVASANARGAINNVEHCR
jgi:hypothetical protein